MNQDTASQSSLKSSYSQSDYRMINLDRARIVIRHKGLPEHIQSRVDSIIQPETSEEMKSILFSIADSLCDAFPVVLEVASREDDSVEIIYRALESMDTELFSKVFAFRRKAGIVDLFYNSVSFCLHCLRLGPDPQTQYSTKILPVRASGRVYQ